MELSFDIQRFIRKFCDPNIEPFKITSNLTLQNQRTINIDVARTKSSILTPKEKQDLEVMLSYYCETENHTYKQGMNEILVPFLLLGREGVPSHIIYTCFSKFIEKFITTLFRDDYFKPLTGLFYITRLILIYHFPEIQKCFDKNSITPDIYMTSWFVTMFAGKIKSLPLLYILWEKLAECGKVIFLSYFGVALLGQYRSLILEHDELTFPSVFKMMNIDNPSVFLQVLERTEDLKKNMPFTSEWVLTKYDIFNLEKTETFSSELEKWPCLLVLPRCILSSLFHEKACKCKSDSNCEVQLLKYVLVDCRPESETKKGHFFKSKLLTKGALKCPEKLAKFPSKFLSVKSTHHIVLMGSSGKEENIYLKGLLKAFYEFEFKYISCIEGGYPMCHAYAKKKNIPFVSHNYRDCKECLQSGKKPGNFESSLDRFFRLDTSKRTDIMNEKSYKCKFSEKEDFEISGIGLVVTNKVIAVINKKTFEISEELPIEKLKKIAYSKEKAEVLRVTFKDGAKRKWILDSTEVKKFLDKVRGSYRGLKKIKNDINK